MNVSALFIRRPIGTTLLSVGLFLIGAVAYFQLPVASLPSVDLPAVRVNAARPGADPGIMAATVAAPLERRLGEIAGVNEMTSSSSLGASSIQLQFDLSRNVDDAARDVQAALNAAVTDLPGDLPALPTYRKANSASFPVLILALTSDTLPVTTLYDAADTVIAQKISQVAGVAEVTVNGAAQPAIRVRLDPQRLAAMGLSLDAIRTAIGNANVGQAIGSFDGPDMTETLATSDRLSTPDDFRNIVVRSRNGTDVRLADVAQVTRGNKSRRAAGWYDDKPSVLLIVTKQPRANVIDTVDGVKALLPELRRWVQAGVDISIFTDRTVTIRAAVRDIQITLLITCALVMGVVFAFLRRMTPTLAAGVAVPLSLAGTVAAMWTAGFSLDNLSLMSITISVGFVVDDAIVMIETVTRNIERGMRPVAAALAGSRQIGFTVVSISLSLVAAFIPLLFLGGIIGAFFREFSLTLTFAVAASTIVSLTLTPMLCAHFMKPHDHRPPSRLDRLVEGALARLVGFYGRTLGAALRHPWVMVLVFFATIGLTVVMFKDIPKGFVPEDDTGLIMGITDAAADVSFPAMAKLQRHLGDEILHDPAVEGVGSFIGGGSGGVNSGQLFIGLKPEGQRPTAAKVIDRLRKRLADTPGIRLFMIPIQDLRAGGRSGKGTEQFSLWDADLDELQTWQPKIQERLAKIPGIADLSTDREQGGLQAEVVIDRAAASRLGVAIQSIDDALGDAFGERQVSTIYGQRNQYRVVLEVAPSDARDPADLTRIYVPGTGGVQVPLSAFTTIVRRASPLVVNHQGAFPSVTLSYNLKPGASAEIVGDAIRDAVAGMHLPDGLHADFAGDALVARQASGGQAILFVAAIVAMYIILGILYESLTHPLTILSTLPSAGLGALIALRVVGMELTVIAFIGIMLLIGIVKKNGILLVDFAIHAERERGMSSREAIHAACIERFRPILMTTLAALFGAMPIAFGEGVGAELRRPLGVTIMGGLILSQVLTLYTTPIVYLGMARLQRVRWPFRRRFLVPGAAIPAGE